MKKLISLLLSLTVLSSSYADSTLVDSNAADADSLGIKVPEILIKIGRLSIFLISFS